MQRRFRSRVIVVLLPLALPAMLAALEISAVADDEPTIAKDSIRVYVTTGTCNFGEHGCDKNTKFLNPYIFYNVNGPIASGSQLSVEITVPGKPPRKWDCGTREKAKGNVLNTECGSKGGEGDRGFSFEGAVYTGPVGFSIHMRNELQGANATLFSGMMKVGKAPSPPGAADMQYYVDEDWRLPIGYIFLVPAENGDGRGGPGASMFHAALWFRGNASDVEAHMFYQGKDVAKTGSCTSRLAAEALKTTMWGGRDCQFDHVYDIRVPSGWPEQGIHLLSKNPGEYEIKVLSGGHLARSIKFAVAADGTFDNGIATSNKLGSKRIIVPVQVIGNAETWDKTAWKTGAFYGNPLTGFTAVP